MSDEEEEVQLEFLEVMGAGWTVLESGHNTEPAEGGCDADNENPMKLSLRKRKLGAEDVRSHRRREGTKTVGKQCSRNVKHGVHVGECSTTHVVDNNIIVDMANNFSKGGRADVILDALDSYSVNKRRSPPIGYKSQIEHLYVEKMGAMTNTVESTVPLQVKAS
jgi:hypothetical protein